LRDAGIEKCNLVTVSSIYPPNCKVISKQNGLKCLIPGAITYCVMSKNCSNENKRLIVSSVGCAIPADNNSYGYISEYHAFGQTAKVAGDYAEDLAAAMLASTLGVSFDIDKSWDERKEIFKISGEICIHSKYITSGICKTKLLHNSYRCCCICILKERKI